MRSSACLLTLALLATTTVSAVEPPTSPPISPAPAPTREQVNAELATLRANPDLAGKITQKTLRFKEFADDKKANKPASLPEWLRSFARWMSDTGRALVWMLAALAVAVALVSLRHWVRVRAGATKGSSAGLPSHIRELDIRPESLPDQIGAAAAVLWQRDEHRAALSLLYRGALSRLVHQHAVPIRAASTEGECLALAALRMAPERSAFFARLVQAWQQAVYGARLPESSSVLALCADFDTQLRAAPMAQVGP
ncbi:MAG: DUF4129 domain-containing protein [Rhizobacter sp.]